MKLRDIVNIAHTGVDLLKFNTSWKLDDDGNINPVFQSKFDLDTEVKVVYYWYHHMNPNVQQKEINDIIMNHDFKKFWDISEEIEENSPYLCYFPATACVVSKDEYIGDLNIFRSEETFACITWSECECG